MYTLDKENKRLKKINKKLSERLKALKNDSLAIEKELRKRGLVKRGEVVIDIEGLDPEPRGVQGGGQTKGGKAKPEENRRRERRTVDSQ